LNPRLQPILLALTALALLSGCAQEQEKPRELSREELHGQRVFGGACAVCHRADSTDPLNGPGLKSLFKKEYLPSSGLKVSDKQVRETILHGRKNMPPMGGLMDDQQMNDLLAYLKTL
jgi:cytochrome c